MFENKIFTVTGSNCPIKNLLGESIEIKLESETEKYKDAFGEYRFTKKYSVICEDMQFKDLSKRSVYKSSDNILFVVYSSEELEKFDWKYDPVYLIVDKPNLFRGNVDEVIEELNKDEEV